MSRAERGWVLRDLRVSDYVTLAVVLCAGLASLVFICAISRETGGQRTAVVQVEGNVIHRQELVSGQADSLVRLELPRGEVILEASGGRIRVLPMPDSVCPLHICSQTGWIERPGELIACVPNKLVITIEGGKKPPSDALDGVTPGVRLFDRLRMIHINF